MPMYFEVRATYHKLLDNGKTKKTTEAYVVDAMSCTEAEAVATRELSAVLPGEFSISQVKKLNLSEIFAGEGGDVWYSVKAVIESPTDDGKVKATPLTFLVRAEGFEDAVKRFNQGMRNTLADYSIAAVSETAIMDVYDKKAE